MRATRAYHDITQKPITPKVAEWIDQMVEANSDATVERVMIEVGQSGKLARFLETVQRTLATEAAMRRTLPPPTEIEPATLMAIVRGEVAPPEGPWIYDASGLPDAEYTEVLAWSSRRRFGDLVPS